MLSVVLAPAVLIAVQPLLGPCLWLWSERGSNLGCLWVVCDCSDLGVGTCAALAVAGCAAVQKDL